MGVQKTLLGRADAMLVLLLLLLVLGGGLMFSSAAVGLLARGATHISSVVFNHFALGVGLGVLGLLIAFSIDYHHWRKLAPYAFFGSLIGTALVFIPGLGMEHGGGLRWIDLGFFTLQPSEFLKIGAVIGAAAVFTALREESNTWRGALAFIVVAFFPTIVMALQPDFGTLGIILISVFGVALAAGVPWRYIGLIAFVGVLGVFLLSLSPRYAYLGERIQTFMNPGEQNALGEGFQIRQSLIAIGAGGLTGSGLGQGVQKFTYLPEPMGDSIFAVIAEELGFIGGGMVILVFLIFGLKGFGIAAHAPDLFGALLAVGLSVYLVGEAFINIAAMLGLAPLTGIPLTFVSQGGSAMLASLTAAGILLNVSRRAKH